jgi:hypothetical protein
MSSTGSLIVKLTSRSFTTTTTGESRYLSHSNPHNIADIPSTQRSLRATELSLLSAPSSSKGDPQNDLAEFYTRLDKIKSYHARHPNLEPETKNFARGVQELVDGDGLTRIRGEDGEEEIIDRG